MQLYIQTVTCNYHGSTITICQRNIRFIVCLRAFTCDLCARDVSKAEGSNMSKTIVIGSVVAGDRLLEAASKAAAKAAEAAEATRQRMQQSAEAASGSPSMEAGTSNAAVNTPPTKPVRNKRSVLKAAMLESKPNQLMHSKAIALTPE